MRVQPTLRRLPVAIREAVEAHFAGGEDAIPAPTPLEKPASNLDYCDGIWMLADIDLSRIDTKAIDLNITRPENLLQRIDA